MVPGPGHDGVVGADSTLRTIDLDLPGRQSGKVREAWPLSDGRRLLITTDRLSAFDHIIGVVGHKGQVLNQLSAWWFDQTADIVANHLIDVPDPIAAVAIDAEPLPIEVVIRGRLTGSSTTSLLPRYLDGERSFYGQTLPDGLSPHEALPKVLLTPTTKAAKGGHDEPIAINEVADRGLVDPDLWAQVQDVAFKLFHRGSEIAADAGFVLADTKYEFGLGPGGELLLIDEVHTPDSSRYWSRQSLAERLSGGEHPESFDKEPVRLALRELGFIGDGTPPDLADEVWTVASQRYVEIYEAITGQTFEPGARPVEERLRNNLAELIADST